MAYKIKGGVVGTIDNFNKTFEKKAKSSTAYPTRIPKAGESIIGRFLTGPEEWVEFYQFFSPTDGYVIETEENSDHYREQGLYPSKLFLAAFLIKATNQVVALELKKTLAEQIGLFLEKQAKKGKTLQDFDLELFKNGTGTDTKYHYVLDSADEVDLSNYVIPDLWETVKALLGDDDGDDTSSIEDDVEEEVAKPKVTSGRFAPKAK